MQTDDWIDVLEPLTATYGARRPAVFVRAGLCSD
jgi:hypothetical protein